MRVEDHGARLFVDADDLVEAFFGCELHKAETCEHDFAVLTQDFEVLEHFGREFVAHLFDEVQVLGEAVANL